MSPSTSVAAAELAGAPARDLPGTLDGTGAAGAGAVAVAVSVACSPAITPLPAMSPVELAGTAIVGPNPPSTDEANATAVAAKTHAAPATATRKRAGRGRGGGGAISISGMRSPLADDDI